MDLFVKFLWRLHQPFHPSQRSPGIHPGPLTVEHAFDAQPIPATEDRDRLPIHAWDECRKVIHDLDDPGSGCWVGTDNSKINL